MVGWGEGEGEGGEASVAFAAAVRAGRRRRPAGRAFQSMLKKPGALTMKARSMRPGKWLSSTWVASRPMAADTLSAQSVNLTPLRS